jgi:hypothetical protein
MVAKKMKMQFLKEISSIEEAHKLGIKNVYCCETKIFGITFSNYFCLLKDCKKVKK